MTNTTAIVTTKVKGTSTITTTTTTTQGVRAIPPGQLGTLASHPPRMLAATTATLLPNFTSAALNDIAILLLPTLPRSLVSCHCGQRVP